MTQQEFESKTTACSQEMEAARLDLITSCQMRNSPDTHKAYKRFAAAQRKMAKHFKAYYSQPNV